MRITDSYIFLDNIRFHAFHGVFPQERKIGADFSVSVRAAVGVSAAVDHDIVEVTLNYAELYEVVKSEMMKPSDLLEHVAGRIGQAVFDTFPQVRSLQVSVTKLNPPMGADCDGAGVELHLINDKTHV
jgi:dihydroneopterin aldolase